MTKTQLQIALAETTLPGFGKLVKQKRKARTGINPKTREKIKIPAKNSR